MAKPTVVIEGLDENLRALRETSKDLQNQLKRSYVQAGDMIADEAQRRVPTKSGRLRKSVKSRPTLREGRVKMGTPSRVPYAGWIEFGGTIVHHGSSHSHGQQAQKTRARVQQQVQSTFFGRTVTRRVRRTVVTVGEQRHGRAASGILGLSRESIGATAGVHLIQRKFVKRGRYFWPAASQQLPRVRVFLEEQIERLMRRKKLLDAATPSIFGR